MPILVAFACLLAPQPSLRDAPNFRLQVVPAVVYKVDDPGNTKTSSFVFDVAVLDSSDPALAPASATVELASGRTTVDRQAWSAGMLAKIKGQRYSVHPDTPFASPVRILELPEAFELRFYFRCPQAFAIDSISIRLTAADSKGGRSEHTLRIPVQYYRQKTSLICPFRGNGVVGQDWITNGGHGGGFGNDFALDLRGLDQNFAEVRNGGDGNPASAGWGREIIAPAAGTVAYARNDVPDNPRPGTGPDDNWYRKLHDPILASLGNCVVIDHGNSEFSLMAHMQEGSVVVRAGDHVTAGQLIGKLGNSGDAFGPHLHYQLQSDPRLFHGHSLPFRFENTPTPLYRGRQFQAS